ncbi:hypothetical protein RF11_10245 [Thelohanellus kitauei]|uniref:Uncharacterized protein n=1 Tax=Thelohanellus kitauei TaxID=669202 RepID=A0A0C2NDV2_THEKT|nr:hypothetical protein RF11_10245 [Thelohanellus kitauei]
MTNINPTDLKDDMDHNKWLFALDVEAKTNRRDDSLSAACSEFDPISLLPGQNVTEYMTALSALRETPRLNVSRDDLVFWSSKSFLEGKNPSLSLKYLKPTGICGAENQDKSDVSFISQSLTRGLEENMTKFSVVFPRSKLNSNKQNINRFKPELANVTEGNIQHINADLMARSHPVKNQEKTKHSSSRQCFDTTLMAFIDCRMINVHVDMGAGVSLILSWSISLDIVIRSTGRSASAFNAEDS